MVGGQAVLELGVFGPALKLSAGGLEVQSSRQEEYFEKGFEVVSAKLVSGW